MWLSPIAYNLGNLWRRLATRIGQVLPDEFNQVQSFVQLPNQNQAAVGGHPAALEIHPQRAVEREPKRAAFVLTQWPSSTATVLIAFKPA